MHSGTAEEREMVMKDDGPQLPIKHDQLHHGPATRGWCSPLLLLLLLLLLLVAARRGRKVVRVLCVLSVV